MDDDLPPLSSAFPSQIVVRECRPWLWIFVIVLSTLSGGMTGLYTGSYLAAEQSRTMYEKRLADQNIEHQQEITRMSQNMVVLSGAVQALSARMNNLGHQVGEVQDKVEKHDQVAAAGAATAKKALETAKLTKAKTDVLEARVEKAVPASAASAPKSPAPLSPSWWRGSAKH